VLAAQQTPWLPADERALIGVLVLNYNGRGLLAECLPSVLAAAEASRYFCRVIVVDNDSADGSTEFVAGRFAKVEVVRQPNRGLCSFNDVLATLAVPVAVLLNNDIKLDRGCIDLLVEPLLRRSTESRELGRDLALRSPPSALRAPLFLTAPRCWLFDGQTYEGMKTAVSWRWGIVQATALFPGHERLIDLPGPTASAGAAMAVDRELFLELGGFDSRYLPGRIEDLDFAFRGYMAGYEAVYVPAAIAYHRGMATFGPKFSAAGCDHLALRNTLLFQWKNLRHPKHVLRQVVGLPARLLRDLVAAPFVPRGKRLATWRALSEAWRRRTWPSLSETRRGVAERRPHVWAREAAFFRNFHPRAMLRAAQESWPNGAGATVERLSGGERLRDRRHPISRWYLLPLADWLARRLTPSVVRPWHVTLCGVGIAGLAAVALGWGLGTIAAILVLAAWFCDRLDGKLARRQQTETRCGAWLDANLDELADLGLHAALALAAGAASHSSLPWALFTAFLLGKYLFLYGLASDELAAASPPDGRSERQTETGAQQQNLTWLRRLYHLPGNADVRVHLLMLLLAAGWWTAELLLVAAYFNLRWMARYALIARRHDLPLTARGDVGQAFLPSWQMRQTGMSAPRKAA
jgi:GT2 family glycosyltransferase/phosphatidylglycerophosphate synthase